METTEELMQRHVAVECSNCGGDAWIEATAFGAEAADFPLAPRWHEMTAPVGIEYMPARFGFCLDFTGHYNGFTDDIYGDLYRTTLCHDCSVAVARALPGVFKKHTGWHPATGDESCCEFCYTFGDEGTTLYGDGNGGWVPQLGKI